MKKWNLFITLKSDLCVATGAGEAGLTNIKTALEHAVPYIPAKRMKGSLRMEGREMADNGVIPHRVIDELFGRPGSEGGGLLQIKDAHIYQIPGYLLGRTEQEGPVIIDDYSSMEAELSVLPETEAQAIEDMLTIRRTRTALNMETGAAAKGSLRTMQLVPRGVVFLSRVECEEGQAYETALNYCVKALRHMGMEITRGLGEVRCELRPVETEKEQDCQVKIQEEIRPDEKIMLSFELFLKDPVLLAGSRGLYEDCREQIPGSAMLGALAGMYVKDHGLGGNAHEDTNFRRIFLSGGVQFGYAFLKKGDKVYYPCPAAFARKKRSSDQWVNRFRKGQEGERRKEITDQICLKDGRLYLAGVKKEIHMHHARPEDRGIGHALNDRAADTSVFTGRFYQYQALSKGQTFAGTWTGSAGDLKLLLSCLEKRDYRIRLGRSRTAEYGECIFRPRDIKKVSGNSDLAPKGKKWLVWLTAPLVLTDQKTGSPEANPQLLLEELRRKLDCGKIEAEMILKFTVAGGYNSKWRLPSIQYPALDQGTCFLLETEREISADQLEQRRWGLLTERGFGQLKAVQEKETSSEDQTIYEGEEEAAGEFGGTKSVLGQALEAYKKRKRELSLQNTAAMEAIEKQKGALPASSFIEKLIGLAEKIEQNQDGYNALVDEINKISSKEKKQDLLKFMEPCENKSPEFIKTYLENAKWAARNEEE